MRFADAFAAVIAIQDGGLDQARHGAGRGVADRNRFNHIIAAQHVADAVEELDRIDLRRVIVQKPLDEDDDGDGADQEDQPQCQTVLRKQQLPKHTILIRFRLPSSKAKVGLEAKMETANPR